MIVITAVTDSHLAIRAQRRAAEAIRPHEEMEDCSELDQVLLAPRVRGRSSGRISGPENRRALSV